MSRRLHSRAAASILLMWAVASLTGLDSSHADTTIMRGCRAPRQFKIYDGHLTADQKRCLRYALKQWVMYDAARSQKKLSTGRGPNRNETARGVMTPGPYHILQNAATTNPAKKHHLCSRCMSVRENNLMRRVYGATSPFHDGSGVVADPVKNPGAWFTSNELAADLTIEPVQSIPGYEKNRKVVGRADYALTKGQFLGVASLFKSRFADRPAVIYMRISAGKTRDEAKPRTWFYATDSDTDGWITNMDTKPPENQLDYYQMIKHELGHWFCFWHKGAAFTEAGGVVPWYNDALEVLGLQSPADESGCCQSRDSEFTEGRSGWLFIASNRPGGFGGSDIWLARWDDSLQTYTDVINLGPGVNSAYDETDPEAGAGDAWLYFASNRPGGFGGYDIYMAERIDSTSWGSVSILPSTVNSTSDDIAPLEWNDTFYFASDRPGGVGGFDLYRSHQDVSIDSLWDLAVNLGLLNSTFDDVDPFVAWRDGDSTTVLYFASDRPGGAGGFDVYRADQVAGTWLPATNIGAPVNGPANDRAPYIPPYHDRIFFVSDRNAGAGWGEDLFEALNALPRPHALTGHDVEGLPGDTVAIAFTMVNQGNYLHTATPEAWSEDGWPVFFDNTPRPLTAAGQETLVVAAAIPPTAVIGDTSRVGFAFDLDGRVDTTWALIYVRTPVTGVHTHRTLPRVATLEQNVPNPFNPSTTIAFTLPRRMRVSLRIHDVSGRRVRTLVEGYRNSRRYTVRWDGRDDRGIRVASGVYYYRLVADGVILARKMVLLK